MFGFIWRIPDLRWIPSLTRASPTQLPRGATQECGRDPSHEDIRNVITELLSQCDIPYYRTPYDQDLHDLCIQECKLKGYPIDGRYSILESIPCGVCIASTTYGHLKNRSTQVFIAMFTAFGAWIDDTYIRDIRGLDTFIERFVVGQKQANEALDGLARVLSEINHHYYGVQADVILTSMLNFVTSLMLEFETRGMAVSPHAESYATYMRVMSGISEAYTMLIFPPDVPMKTYIDAVPETCMIINYFNDVLSFYKEEFLGENANYVSNEASLRGEKKIVILRKMVHDISLCISRVVIALEDSGEARDVFQCFLGGYVSFHTSCNSRYHLDDLFPPETI